MRLGPPTDTLLRYRGSFANRAWHPPSRPDVFRRGVTLDGGNGLQLRALSEHMGRARLSRGLPRKIRRSAGGLRLCLREHTATS
jgi:hypothetical protein